MLDCDPGTRMEGLVVQVVIDVLVYPSSVATEFSDEVSGESDWGIVETQSSSFSKECSLDWADSVRSRRSAGSTCRRRGLLWQSGRKETGGGVETLEVEVFCPGLDADPWIPKGIGPLVKNQSFRDKIQCHQAPHRRGVLEEFQVNGVTIVGLSNRPLPGRNGSFPEDSFCFARLRLTTPV